MKKSTFNLPALWLFVAASLGAQAPANYRIGAQDVLAIKLVDEAALNGNYAVDADGTVSFPYVGRLKAAGMTVPAFEALLRGRLADGYFNDPQLSVSVDQFRSQRVYVIGEVRLPGAFPLTGELTVIDALSKAGSTTPLAGPHVQIVKGGNGVAPTAALAAGEQAANMITIRLADLRNGASGTGNRILEDGDTIYVPKAVPVFIVGQVKTPGSYPLELEMTVQQALALAGGMAGTGAVNRIQIVRNINGQRTEIRASLEDPVFPGDTIVVPMRRF